MILSFVNNNERICKSMVFGLRSAPAVGAKGAQ